MKKIHVLLSSVLLLALLLGSNTYAQKKKYEFSRERSISQTYNVSSGDKLNLSNQFGTVVVKTWSRNEVKVDIKIELSSTDKEKTDEMFENIDVNHGKDGSTIYFKTVFDKTGKKHAEVKNGKSYSNSINIDYEVSMPANLAMKLKHQFGNVTLPDLQGKVDIDQQFGDLTAGRLSNPGKISVQFGNAEIESVDGGEYSFQFVGNTALIKSASGDIDVTVQHCKNNGVVIYAANANSVNVDAQHSDVALVVPRDMSAQYTVNTHFGKFKNNSSFSIKSDDDDDDDRRGPRFDYSYKGSSGQGRTKVKMKGNFTDFIIGHEAPPAKPKKEKTKSV
ncbi:MAG TPA: hypothetical protein VD996_08185 [Chitinophagaceae bacterium]|nr:hypothetical protein [Chitinophagaceae bacterium]